MGIKVNLSGVKKKTSSQALDRGRYALGNQMLADMNPFVPKKNNSLRQSGHLSSDNEQILYQMPYAKRQFYLNGKNYSTPGTGPRWDLKAKGIYMPSWRQAFLRGAGY